LFPAAVGVVAVVVGVAAEDNAAVDGGGVVDKGGHHRYYGDVGMNCGDQKARRMNRICRFS
jgi:hypothetical protein